MLGTTQLKRKLADAACHATIGSLLSYTFSNRIRSRGIVVDTSHPLIVPVVKAQLFWGFYERSEIRFVRQYLRTDMDVVELGSSLGLVSCLIRKLLPLSCRLICVEAHPQLIDVIEANLRNNSLTDNVSVLSSAIHYGETDQLEVSFSSAADTLGGQVAPLHAEGSVRVKTTTLSRIIAENSLKEFCLVSDIEGAEAGLILEDAAALKNCRQIIIELHDTIFKGRALGITELRDTLVAVHGFKLRDQHGPVCVFEK
jgi:FkbM family methyltransferase